MSDLTIEESNKCNNCEHQIRYDGGEKKYCGHSGYVEVGICSTLLGLHERKGMSILENGINGNHHIKNDSARWIAVSIYPQRDSSSLKGATKVFHRIKNGDGDKSSDLKKWTTDHTLHVTFYTCPMAVDGPTCQFIPKDSKEDV